MNPTELATEELEQRMAALREQVDALRQGIVDDGGEGAALEGPPPAVLEVGLDDFYAVPAAQIGQPRDVGVDPGDPMPAGQEIAQVVQIHSGQ